MDTVYENFSYTEIKKKKERKKKKVVEFSEKRLKICSCYNLAC